MFEIKFIFNLFMMVWALMVQHFEGLFQSLNFLLNGKAFKRRTPGFHALQKNFFSNFAYLYSA